MSFFPWLLLALMIALIIHLLFLFPAPFDWLIPTWGAGDVLGYCGSILGAVAAIGSVTMTIKKEGEYRRDDLKRSVKPLLVLEIAKQPDVLNEKEINNYINVDRVIIIKQESCNTLPVITYPESISALSKEQCDQIMACIKGYFKAANGLECYLAKGEKRFLRIESKSVGRGPAINISVHVEGKNIELPHQGGVLCHVPTVQGAVGASFSLGVFIDGLPSADVDMNLVIQYSDCDMRRYEQTHQLSFIHGDENTCIQSFNLKISQHLIEDDAMAVGEA